MGGLLQVIKPKNFKKALNIPTCIIADDAKLMIALVHVNKKMLSQRAIFETVFIQCDIY